MKKKLLKFIEELQNQSFSGWTVTAQGGYETALTTIKEKVKTIGKPEYVYSVRRIYSSSSEIEAFDKEIQNDGWEVLDTHRTNEDTSYIIFTLRKEKE